MPSVTTNLLSSISPSAIQHKLVLGGCQALYPAAFAPSFRLTQAKTALTVPSDTLCRSMISSLVYLKVRKSFRIFSFASCLEVRGIRTRSGLRASMMERELVKPISIIGVPWALYSIDTIHLTLLPVRSSKYSSTASVV